MDADPAATIEELFYRVARLEHSLQEARIEAQAEEAEILVAQIEISDALVRLAESIGVPTSAQMAMLARGVTELGQRFMAGLARWGVGPIETLGRPPDRETCDIMGYEVAAGVPDGLVLRETLPGYLWRGLVLRRAQVIVSGRAPGTDDSRVTLTGEQPGAPSGRAPSGGGAA